MLIPRRKSALREDGHIKHMYCSGCGEITAFEERSEDTQVKFWEKFHEGVVADEEDN